MDLRRFPWVSLFLGLASVVFYFLAPNSLQDWLRADGTGQIIRWIFHPIIHNSLWHLIGNVIFGWPLVGTLVESWMMFSRRVRLAFLLYCYLVSLIISLIMWKAIVQVPLVGLSGMISAGLGLLLAYYFLFFNRISFHGLNAFAPVCIGFALGFLVLSTLQVIASPSEQIYPVTYHGIAFLASLVLFLDLLKELRKGIQEAH